MSASLVLRTGDDPTSSDGNLTARFENTVNAPINSVTILHNGQMVGGTYELTFAKPGAVTVTVVGQGDASTSRNPWGDRTGLPVTADDATVNKDIVPGLGLVISSSVDTGWEAIITVGNALTSGAVWTEILEFEIVQSDAQSSSRQVACRNVGTEEAESCYLYALPGCYFDGTGAETFIDRLAPHTDPTRHKLASTEQDLVITFQDWKDDVPSGKKSADIYVGANKCVEDALFDGATFYQHGVSGYDDGNDYLAGYGIRLPDITDDPTSASITLSIRAGYSWIEWAPDVAGSPGTWQSTDLSLGDIPAASHVLAHVRMNIPSAATPDDPCRMTWLRARGLSI